MFDSRSEGLATAMEETLMQAGLYDDNPRGREVVWIMLANRAARGLASLYVQVNQLTLQQAGSFHAQWTPRGWSDPSSDLVAFEQLLYLRQPGYGTSYITGKLQFERLISEYAHERDRLATIQPCGFLRPHEQQRNHPLRTDRNRDGRCAVANRRASSLTPRIITVYVCCRTDSGPMHRVP